MKTNRSNNKQIRIYLVIIYIICYGLAAIALFSTEKGQNTAYDVLQKVFTILPVTAALVTRRITKDSHSMHFSIKVWKNIKIWALSAFLPGILIVAGSILYYCIFSGNYNGIFRYGLLIGSDTSMQINSPIMFALICILISALCFPVQLLELGEEVGWRGYLLPLQIEKHGSQKAVLLNGFEWGLAHLPLIYFGFNYSNYNWGAPWSNMVLMLIFCIVLGVLCSYVTMATGNCIYAAIIHGVVNVIGEIPVYLSVSMKNGLMGPNPTGFLSMLFIIFTACIFWIKLRSKNIK